MKNKIIASLLAVCMFVGLAVPAFATKANSNEVKEIVLTKTEHIVKKDESVNLKDFVIALKDASQMASDAEITYELTSNPDLAFVEEATDGTFTAVEAKGTATVTIKNHDGKVVKTATLKAATAATALTRATGFQFASTLNKVAVGAGAGDAKIEIVATPAGSAFAANQRTAIATALSAAGKLVAGVTLADGAFVLADSNKKIVVTVPSADLTGLVKAAAKLSDVTVAFPTNDEAAPATVSRRATTNVELVTYKLATLVANKGNITVKVGSTVDFANNIKQGPSDATKEDAVTYTTDYVDNATAKDFIEEVTAGGSKYLATEVGKVKVIATLSNGATTSFVVDVVPYSAATSTATLIEKSTIKVGGTVKLEVKNVPTNTTVTWKVENTNVQIDKFVGATTTVYGKKAGTVKVTAIITDATGAKTEKVCTVTVEAAATKPTTPTTPSKPGTSNPQTGDSLFANLF